MPRWWEYTLSWSSEASIGLEPGKAMNCRTPGFPVLHHLLEFAQGKAWKQQFCFFWPEKWEGPDYRNLSTRLHSLDAHLRKAFRSFSLHNFWVSLVAQKVRICLQCKRPQFNPWVVKIPWRREWQPTSMFLPAESNRQRSLAGYSPWGCKESDITEWLSTHNINYNGIYIVGAGLQVMSIFASVFFYILCILHKYTLLVKKKNHEPV